MGSYLHRYRTDGSEPTKRAFARDVIVRGLLPALVLLGAVVLFATFLLPFGGIGAEAEVNQVLQEGRTPALDLAAATVSHLAGVVGAPLTAIIAFFVLRRRTGQWWLALVPLVSVALEALVYQTAALLVGRRRPEGVEQMDWGLPHA
ncbi:MAG TPA: phospholipid phosphatase, partial [Propionibacterium sp.]|nr:phospholipid phosphatase [Propionibacterium sp.]